MTIDETITNVDPALLEQVLQDKDIADYVQKDPQNLERVKGHLARREKEYKSVLTTDLPDNARTAGTVGSIGADILTLLSGGIGSYIKFYTIGARATLELPSLLRTVAKEGLYHGTLDTMEWTVRKALNFFLPGGALLDLKSVQKYAKNAVVREAKNDILEGMGLQPSSTPLETRVKEQTSLAQLKHAVDHTLQPIRDLYAHQSPEFAYAMR